MQVPVRVIVKFSKRYPCPHCQNFDDGSLFHVSEDGCVREEPWNTHVKSEAYVFLSLQELSCRFCDLFHQGKCKHREHYYFDERHLVS